MAEEEKLELVVVSKAGREALVDGRLRDAQVAACSNAIACWTASWSNDLWCGSRHKSANPKPLSAREVALLDILQRGVGKCRTAADDWTGVQACFTVGVRDVTRFRFRFRFRFRELGSQGVRILATYF